MPSAWRHAVLHLTCLPFLSQIPVNIDDDLYHMTNDDDSAEYDDNWDDEEYVTVYTAVYDLIDDSYLEQVGVPFAFLQLQWTLITTVVSERKSKVKEGMLMMGLRESAYWVS